MQNENNKQASVIAASDLQRQVGTVIRRVAKNGEHLVVERDGIPVLVLIPIAEYENWKRRQSRSDGK